MAATCTEMRSWASKRGEIEIRPIHKSENLELIPLMAKGDDKGFLSVLGWAQSPRKQFSGCQGGGRNGEGLPIGSGFPFRALKVF